MIDLKEAVASLDSYAGRLNALCSHYEYAVSLAEIEKKIPDVGPMAADLRDDLVVELERVHGEALELDILVTRTVREEVASVFEFPQGLAKLLDAQNRLDPISRRANDLLKEQDKKQAEKEGPPEEDPFSRALRELRER